LYANLKSLQFMKKVKTDFFRKYHKWLGLIITINLLMFAGSGILLNHRSLIAHLHFPRKYMPEAYHINNWNNGVVKRNLTIGKDSILIYGNSGIWLTDSAFTNFTEFNAGLPTGTDYRKVETAIVYNGSHLLIGTQHGLYEYRHKKWTPIYLGNEEQRVISLTESNGKLFAITRSELFVLHPFAKDSTWVIEQDHIPAYAQNTEVGLFRTLWVIHSGEIYGKWGKLLVDFLGLCMATLAITGIIYFIIPVYIKKKRDKVKEKLSKIKIFNQKNLKIHNTIGVWLLPLLLLNTLTGMFLRPPFLIPIANSVVSPIPYTKLAAHNYWEDKLRLIQYDEDLKSFLLFTSEGVYTYMPFSENPPVALPSQPTISVMGINLCEKIAPYTYLIGSFSGLYIWNIKDAYQLDAMNMQPVGYENRTSRPIGEQVISGLIKASDSTYYYSDYNTGIQALHHHQTFTAMPEEMKDIKMPLWNISLEIHTGRIFQGIMGDFYILIVPLTGLATLFVLISGVITWYKIKYKRKKVIPNTISSSES